MGANPLDASAMFFAGLILLIPHRIGMSRVNYVIKRYNLPISRAGLLLYKFHNPIEVSLTIGTFFGNVLNWNAASLGGVRSIRISMRVFLSLMLLSSIFMFIVYISGNDYGHLNSFYFSLILITLFDGFSNAHAFALNPKDSALLSAGIPISGLLVSFLHYIYKFFSDLFRWSNFDYYVLLLQLFFNILTLSVTLGLWCKEINPDAKAASFKIMELFRYVPTPHTVPDKREDAHIYDWVPICLLAISLGTVYAFYPSIAPYSIIDFQYASVIELWILIISSILPFVIAVLDKLDYGPSGTVTTEEVESSGPNNVDFSGNQITFSAGDLEVKHDEKTGNPTGTKVKHIAHGTTNWDNTSTPCDGDSSHTGSTAIFHPYNSNTPVTYIIQTSGDQYWDPHKKTSTGKGQAVDIPGTTNKSITLKYDIYLNWFGYRNFKLSGGAGTTLTPGNSATYTALDWTNKDPDDPTYERCYWNLIWLCAIFYILCIQIFMSMLHYSDCLLSCFFNKPRRIGFISVLFNTLRETMQAFGFSGAGKQCTNFLNLDGSHLPQSVDTYTIKGTPADENISTSAATADKPLKLTDIKNSSGPIPVSKKDSETAEAATPITTNLEYRLKTGKTVSFSITKVSLMINNGKATINGSIAATNKLITLFVMMFCVFTGDGYLQHYRRCCRDCWPTTGFNRYQSLNR